MEKRGQVNNASNAAILIVIVTALIVLYILFLPPGERAELLGEDSGSSSYRGGSSGSSSTTTAPSMTLLQENVGRITSLNKDEQDHILPSFRLNTKTDGSVIQEVSSLYVKSSIFDAIIENISFKVDEDITSNLKLSFNTGKQASGRLIILLNNQQIFNDDIGPLTSKVVELPSDRLQRYNVLTIGASSPGWAFWHSNEYLLRNIQITGNIKDVSGATSRQTFTMSEEELENLDRASLRFYADCTTSSGRFDVKVNGRTMSSSFIDCGVLNTIELDERQLYSGENEVDFTIESGNYLITDVMVKSYLKDPIYPIYYFEFDERYFTAARNSNDEDCGEIDGICPDDCEADEDQDCCFDDDGYWCDIETTQFNDRCVSFVSATTCERCSAGYEDDRGRAPEACEDACGDDKDNDCPAGCSPYYDKDCCFENDDYYWCDDAPSAKPLSAVCKAGVEPDERDDCPSRYYDDGGRRLSFTVDDDDDNDDELQSTYSAMLYFEFPNDDLKSATILINGRESGLETRRTSWQKDISDYVRPGTNSIQLEPSRSIDIASLQVKVEK